MAPATDPATAETEPTEPTGETATEDNVVPEDAAVVEDSPPDVAEAAEAGSDDAPTEDEVDDPVDPEDDIVEPEIVDFGAAVEENPEILGLRDEVASLQGRLRAVSGAYQQVQADIEAARERLQRQAAAREERRRGEVVSSLFDPLQNLRRSIDAAQKGATVEDTVEGLEMVVHQFMGAFEKLGLEEVPGKGSTFDPNLHEALTMMPVTDPALDEVVIEVFDAGYRIGKTLIQPARVIVGRYTEPETAEA